MSTEEIVSNMVAHAKVMREAIEEAEKSLKEMKAKERDLLEDKLPAAMDSLGFTELATDDFKLKVDWITTCSIPKNKRHDVAVYAQELGLTDLQKYSIVINFNKEEKEFFDQARAILDDNQIMYNPSLDMNSATWKKAVNGLAEAGERIDYDKACVRRVRSAIIK